MLLFSQFIDVHWQAHFIDDVVFRKQTTEVKALKDLQKKKRKGEKKSTYLSVETMKK
jgi:hypothetical protein